jgi:DNA-binding IscR family transcriptional regulator
MVCCECEIVVMMRMSSQVEYGLRAMLDIALNGSEGPVQAGDITGAKASTNISSAKYY